MGGRWPAADVETLTLDHVVNLSLQPIDLIHGPGDPRLDELQFGRRVSSSSSLGPHRYGGRLVGSS